MQSTPENDSNHITHGDLGGMVTMVFRGRQYGYYGFLESVVWLLRFYSVGGMPNIIFSGVGGVVNLVSWVPWYNFAKSVVWLLWFDG